MGLEHLGLLKELYAKVFSSRVWKDFGVCNFFLLYLYRPWRPARNLPFEDHSCDPLVFIHLLGGFGFFSFSCCENATSEDL